MTHGAGLAIMFPAYMLYNIDVDLERFYRLATEVFKVAPNHYDKKTVAIEGINRLKAFYQSIGMPVSLKETEASKEDLNKLLELVEINMGKTFGNFTKLTLEDAKKIYELAWQ
jgi:alcohol dehydrogenase YqhD (iron-dependent ADH family)